MTVCDCEKRTQHHEGKWSGFGPVRNAERIAFAVFTSTKRNGTRLTAKSFTRGNLADTSQSITRLAHTTRHIFDQFVRLPRENAGDALVGIAWVRTKNLRELVAEIKTNHIVERVRSICVADKVDAGEYDGHATLGYAEKTSDGRSVKQIGVIRAKIDMDLANAFSDIVLVDSISWSSNLAIKIGRWWSKIRTAIVCCHERFIQMLKRITDRDNRG